VQCFYGEIEHSVRASFDVSMIATTDLYDDSQMPQCRYSVRYEHPNGPIVHFATVGDKVFHRYAITDFQQHQHYLCELFHVGGTATQTFMGSWCATVL